MPNLKTMKTTIKTVINKNERKIKFQSNLRGSEPTKPNP